MTVTSGVPTWMISMGSPELRQIDSHSPGVVSSDSRCSQAWAIDMIFSPDSAMDASDIFSSVALSTLLGGGDVGAARRDSGSDPPAR